MWLLGREGSGKSRLLTEFVRSVGRRGAQVAIPASSFEAAQVIRATLAGPQPAMVALDDLDAVPSAVIHDLAHLYPRCGRDAR